MYKSIISRVDLRVADLQRAVQFYEDIVGLRLLRQDGDEAHLGIPEELDQTLLVLHQDRDAPQRAPDEAGLFHIAFRLPDHAALADALRRIQHGHRLVGASNHDISHALYLSDPEGNGLEIYTDNPRDQWPTTADGQIALTTRRLDLQALLQPPPTGHPDRFPPGTDVGHIHLEGTEIAGAESFYAQLLHLNVTVQAPNVLFTAKDDYHHHIGLNGWNRRSRPLNEKSLGLVSIEASLPHLSRDQLLADARSAGVSAAKCEDAVVLRDLNNIPWICRTA